MHAIFLVGLMHVHLLALKIMFSEIWPFESWIWKFIAPPGGMSHQEVLQARRTQVLQNHSRAIERLNWKNLDAELFAETHLELLKGLLTISPQVNKSDLRMCLSAGKFSLTSSEIDLFATKVRDCIKYIRRRLRDMGSGKFLPQSCRAVLKVWTKQMPKHKPKASAKGLSKAKSSSDGDAAGPQGIRDVFGLEAKEKKKDEKELQEISISSSGDDDDAEDADCDAGAATSSSCALQKSTGSPWGGIQQNQKNLPKALARSEILIRTHETR